MSENLDPGETTHFNIPVPEGVTPEMLPHTRIRVSFKCSACSREHERVIIPTCGGIVAADCPCGAELRLWVSPALLES